jgi:hypothetical protein
MPKGGMQTSGTNYSIYCKKCNKPAFKKETIRGVDYYYHFSKAGTVTHKVDRSVGEK